jgi:platelet-activating factor acetylhydrolase IB subunit alpha
MPLTERQQSELNVAILDYLRENGYQETLEVFARETQLSPPKVPAKILEKKWSAVVRLTTKLSQLERRLSTTEVRLKQAQPFEFSDFAGSKKMYDEVIPNAEKFKLKGHQKAINRVLFHPNYTWLVSCGDDAKIGVWDYETGKLEKWLRGHTRAIFDLAFNMNGTLLASCGADTSVKVWNFDDEFRCLKTLNGHDHSVTGVCFLTLNETDVVVSASRDGTVKIWDIQSGYCTKTITDAHDGEWVKKVVVSYEGSLFATCSVDQTVRVFSSSSKSKNMEQIQVFRGHEHVVENMVFSNPNADKVITQSLQGALGRLSSQHSYRPNQLNTNSNENENKSGFDSDESSDSDSEDNNNNNNENENNNTHQPPKYLASASRDKNVCIWEIATGKRVMVLKGHENWVRSLVFHPCGKYLISSADDKSIRVWDLSKQRIHSTMIDAHKGFIASIDWHPKSSLLASAATSRDLNIWYYDKTKDAIVDF